MKTRMLEMTKKNISIDYGDEYNENNDQDEHNLSQYEWLKIAKA